MSRNVSVLHNTFIRSSRCSQNPWHSGTFGSLLAVIGTAVVGPDTAPGSLAPFRRVGYHGNRNITIAGNTISSWYDP